MTGTAVLRWGVAAVTAALLTGGFALGSNVSNLHNALIAVSFSAVGLFVVQRRPGHPEGWLFVATGVAHAVMFFGRQYGLHDGPLPGATWIGWLGVWPLPMVLVLIAVTLMSFPDGRLPSAGWRPVVAVLGLLGLVLSAMSALWPVEYGRTELVARHPLELPGAETATHVFGVARPACYLLFQLVPAACVVWRIRRARGDEARQLRWFVFAVAACAAVMVTGLAVWRSPLPGVLTVPVVAVAAGAAILKYRLYDIDPVINRTLVVGLMAAVVALGYAVVVRGVGSLVEGHGTALSLVATALVAVAFEPLRHRVQRLADRLVHGHRATPYEALARLSAGLATPAGGLLDGMCEALADGVGARRVVLWVGLPEELRPASAWPPEILAPEQSRRLDQLDAVPVVHDGRFLGAITVAKRPAEALTASEQRLVSDLAALAGLILELRASAGRLVAAGDAARRHLERDLHDGVQQRLVTLAMELGDLVRRAESAGAGELAARASIAHRGLLDTNAELRELARGLHPAVLTQDGLEAALDYLADRSAVPVRLDVVLDGRLPSAVEATAYFVVSEALTNAAKHSGTDHVEVRVHVAADGLLLEVADHGCGGASIRPGGGLEGLADRLATLGARLDVASGPSGTRLRTVIPCA
jgi:signal transduction histidine kinase